MKIAKYQEGGAMAAPAEAPAQEQDPVIVMANMFAEGLQTQNCELLAQGAQMFLEMISQAQGGAAPVEEVPAGEPVFKKGGKLSKRRACRK
jgi:hypothetical protein